MWAAAELAAMATDLAEFLGGAIGFALLLQIPLLAGMVLTAAATYAILLLDRWGFRPTEIVLTAFVALIGTCYVAELWIAPVDWTEAAIGAATPHLPDRAALALAAGIVGATIMPHALYLHSGLTQSRIPAESDRRRRLLTRFSNREVVVALSVAGAVNLAIVVLAAAGLRGLAGDEATIGAAYRILGPLLGQAAATLFLVSLIASGISSSVVGTMAGQIVMQGFVGFGIPVWVRRLVTMAPAFAIVALGLDAARALVLSQVVLSLVLPVPLIPLVAFTGRRDIMGPLANGGLTRVAAAAGAGLVVSLDLGLLASQVFG
jgi:manganese transport protein